MWLLFSYFERFYSVSLINAIAYIIHFYVIFVRKRKEVTGGWKRLQNEELHNL